MMYYVMDPEDTSWWGLTARLYFYALLAAGTDLRFIPIKQQGYDPRTMDPEIESILNRFGGAGQNPAAVIIHGSVDTVLQRAKETPELTGPRTVAMVAPRTQDPRLAELGVYGDVWVPSWACQELLARAGVESSIVRLPTDGEPTVARQEDRFVFYSIGAWSRLKMVLEAYLTAFKPTDPVLLHLVCPDAPFADAGGLARFANAADAKHCALVSIDTSRTKRNVAAWKTLHGFCHCYISSTSVFDTYALEAAVAGNHLIGSSGSLENAFDDCKVNYHVVQRSPEKYAEAMKTVLEKGLPAPADWSHRSFETIGQSMLTLLERATRKLAVIVPHRDRDPEMLRAVWTCIKGQLGPDDLFIISDQESSPDIGTKVGDFVQSIGASMVSCSPPACGWSLSLARNAGARLAIDQGAELLLFLDADVLAPPDYVASMRSVIDRGHADIAIASVLNGQTILSADDLPISSWPGAEQANRRPASGCAMMSAAAFKRARGFDETYVGWGSEDIALLATLEALGYKKQLMSSIVAYHQPHDQSPYKELTGAENQARVFELINSEDDEVELPNQEGWGMGIVMILKGKKQ